MKKTMMALLLAAATASATVYTNQPTLLNPSVVKFNLPIGEEVAPVTGDGYTILSPDSPWVFSLGDAVSGEFGAIEVRNTGFAGVTFCATDVGGWPVDAPLQVVVNGEYLGIFTKFVASDESGAITIIPLELGTYATVTGLVVAPPAPRITVTLAAGSPVVRLEGQPGQRYGLWTADALGGPWRRVATGTLDSSGAAVLPCGAGRFFRSE